MKTNIEIFSLYMKGHKKYEVEVSDAPYGQFKVGDKFYHSGVIDACKTVLTQDQADEMNKRCDPDNIRGYFLVIKSTPIN